MTELPPQLSAARYPSIAVTGAVSPGRPYGWPRTATQETCHDHDMSRGRGVLTGRIWAAKCCLRIASVCGFRPKVRGRTVEPNTEVERGRRPFARGGAP